MNLNITSNLIYVSCPYSHPDKSVVNYRMSIVTKYLAQMSVERKIAFSPLLMHYCLNCGIDLPNDYDFWSNHSLTLLSKSDVMHVLTLTGWETSVGVMDEIEFANNNSIPIEFKYLHEYDNETV